MNIIKETIIKTRQWFIDNTQGRIDEAVSGQVRVNDLENYVESMLKRMDDIGAGEWDHTFTFQQRAVYIQTGECHALLP